METKIKFWNGLLPICWVCYSPKINLFVGHFGSRMGLVLATIIVRFLLVVFESPEDKDED